ncbi:GntR family transcriptional regulator [Microbispora sp. CA-135349]|uniref:GntR family transcriptional regulator n=1 Tax=Microbispora sp. CA-135349 TaxID=3239953 RepID=UPI003D8DB48C
MPSFPPHNARPPLQGTQGGEPKYQAIYRDLLAQMNRGELAPGQPLPSQRELSQHYGVSLMTVRQALQRLSSEGRVEQRHGLGTFVAENVIPHEMNSLRSLAEDLALRGVDLKTRLLGVHHVEAPASVQVDLGLSPRADIVLVERLRVIAGRPVILQRSYLPAELARRLADEEFERRPLYRLIEDRCGLVLGSAKESIKPIVLTQEQAELLGQSAGGAALMSDRVTFDVEDKPVLVDRAVMWASHIVYTARRQTPGAAPDPAVLLHLEM